MSERFAKDHLKSFIERVERLEEEKKALSDDIREVMNEAKATGFDTKAIREIIRRRKMDAAELQERDAILETYMMALGMLGGVNHSAGNPGAGSSPATNARAHACAREDDTLSTPARLGDLPGADGGSLAPASHRVEASAPPPTPPSYGGADSNSQSPSIDGDRPRPADAARNPDRGETDDSGDLPPHLRRDADNHAPFMGEKSRTIERAATGPP